MILCWIFSWGEQQKMFRLFVCFFNFSKVTTYKTQKANILPQDSRRELLKRKHQIIWFISLLSLMLHSSSEAGNESKTNAELFGRKQEKHLLWPLSLDWNTNCPQEQLGSTGRGGTEKKTQVPSALPQLCLSGGWWLSALGQGEPGEAVIALSF